MALSKLVNIKVLAPIPYYPGMNYFPSRTNFGRVEGPINDEQYNGLSVFHPRYFSIPKIGRSLYGYLYYAGIIRIVQKIRSEFNFDVILSSFVYPDGYASFLVAKKIKVPHIVEILGSDIYLNCKYAIRKKMVLKALLGSDKIIAMSEALKNEIIGFGVPDKKVIVNYNGVNRNIFHYEDKGLAKQKLNLDPRVFHILFVGNLVPVKGLKYLLQAIEILRKKYSTKIRLHIIGQGNLKHSLTNIAKNIGLKYMVQFLGEKNHIQISLWMKACDFFCLPSLSEGVPNVLLEAMSCGTPVIASKVGGIHEIVISNRYGLLVQPGCSIKLAEVLRTAIEKKWNYREISAYAGKFSWVASAKVLHNELKTACRNYNFK
jgi:glycosyltransferase involved in cell wall biosynthesis